jgi:hypothetical protein
VHALNARGDLVCPTASTPRYVLGVLGDLIKAQYVMRRQALEEEL